MQQTSVSPAVPVVRNVIIDTDPGIDDVVTLALAALSPALNLVAITTTYGNATLSTTTRNARHLVHLCGRQDIVVLPGSDRPILRSLTTAPEVHGNTGVGYAPVPASQPGDAMPNRKVLIDALSRVDRSVTLVTLGPLTNLANALNADEALVHSRVESHIGMFGSMRERGNVNRWADFNAWCDPEAAHRVLSADLSTLMVGLDVTRQMTLNAEEVGAIAASGNPLSEWLGLALRFYIESHRRQGRGECCVVNDVLTVAELLAPGVLTRKEFCLTVHLDDDDHRGHTRQIPTGAPTDVAVGVDVPRVRQLLRKVLGAGWPRPTRTGGRE
jgi:inosine-uridine nucleoside N-ribohydrolase